MSMEELENIDKTINNLRKRIGFLEDEVFGLKNINIQFAIILGLENEEIKELLKIREEDIEPHR